MTALKPSALIYALIYKGNLENSEKHNEYPSCPLILCEEFDLQKKADGSYCHLDSGEVGYFYPLGKEKRLSNWANSIENLIPLSSKHKPEAMDFARRLYQDPDLALIIAADQDAVSLNVKEWYQLQITQGRLFNQYLLPAGQEFLASYDMEKNELGGDEDLWLGFYSPGFDHAPETDAILDFLMSEEGWTLYWQILYPQAGSKEAKDKMEDKLKELGLEKIILVLEQDAKEFLEQN
ncbi:MAG: hypothetical protein Q4E09_06150 [Eubacteriales bacterium]|nr:hypothetical protein [Eubacteriales bacterium]